MDFNFDTSTISTILELDPGTSNLTVAGPAGLIVPIGTTGQRVGANGVIRFNTSLATGGTSGAFEGFDGVKWANVQLASSSNNLSSIDSLNGTGFVVQTGTGAFAERIITVTAGQLTIANGSAVAGNVLLGLANVGTSGSYVSVTTDQFGRVTGGSASQAWSTITGTPTTLSGYGIVDSVLNAGNVVSIASGSTGGMPVAGTNGRLFVGTNSNTLWFDNGTSWMLINPAQTGDVTSSAGTSVTTLATVNANVGTFGSTTIIPVITVNAKGLVTAVNTATISGSISVTGGDLTLSGSTGTAITNATLATVNSNVGQFGDATHVTQLTVNAKGLVTAAANVAIPNSLSFTTDVTGSGTVGSGVALTLATVNGNTGFFGSNSQVATFTVDAKGRTTSAGNVTITPAAIGAVATTTLGANNGTATLDNTGKLTTSQIPASLVGALQYAGTWNATSGNTTSVSTPVINYSTAIPAAGQYFIVATAGSTTLATRVSGNVSVWNVGDTIVSDGAYWDKLDGLSTEVTSVFGRVGAVTATLASTDFANQGTTTTVLHGNAAGNPSWGAINLGTDVTGTLPSGSFPALTGDVTTIAGGVATTLATVNANVGAFGDSTHVATFTVDAKGRTTSAGNVAIPLAVTISGDATGSGNTSGSTAITLATVNSNVGSFGSTTQIPVITVNAKGLVTAVNTATISGSISVTGGDLTLSGSTGTAITNATLATVNGNVGVFGSSTSVPIVTVNAKGLVTGVTTASISGAITLVGDATGSGTTGANTSVTLNTVNGNVGQFGDSSHVAQFTVNAKGLTTAVGNVLITPAAIAAVANAGGAPSIQEGTYASLPAAGTAGRIYVATDTKAIYRDNGASWDNIGSEMLLYAENASTPTAQTVTGANALALGSGNAATGAYSMATGLGATAAVYGGQVRANGSFATAGDAQSGKYVLRNITTVSATPVELFADGAGATARITLLNNSAVAYSALIVAHNITTGNNDGAWKIEGLIRRGANAAATAPVGNRSKTTLTRPNANWDVEVYAANGSLTFQSQANTADTVRWVCTVTTSEVTS